SEKQAVIAELIELLDGNGLLLDKDVAIKAVLLREQTRSTGIGSGVAIPHGKCMAVNELVMAVGIAQEPIDFASVDDKGVQIIILLVSPADQTGPHIQALAQISRLMLDDEFREKLANAKSPQEVYELLNSKKGQ
ncbi:MAG: PTS sugar transporter subunit IIA, partial [Candidatus Mariimomonas ferrooxydans]